MNRSDELNALVILAGSGRFLAQSALRSGFTVGVVDGFCDEDTRKAAICRRADFSIVQHDGELMQMVASTASTLNTDGIVYGGGLEAHAGLLHHLEQEFRLLGNHAEVIAQLGDAHSWFRLLGKLGIPHPEVRFEAQLKASPGAWLLKRAGSFGGVGVRRWEPGNPLPREHYLQRNILGGRTMSALFLACNGRFRLIGFNRLRDHAGTGEALYYRGAVAQAHVPSRIRDRVEECIAKLTETLSLRGINGIDFLVQDGEVLLIDLNARPPATLELHEDGNGPGWMKWHVRACQGEFPSASFGVKEQGVAGHRVIHAPMALEIPSAFQWPEWVSDRPLPGNRIEKGEPLCSLLARGSNEEAVECELEEREKALWSLLSPWLRTTEHRQRGLSIGLAARGGNS